MERMKGGMSKNLDASGDRGYGAGCLEPLNADSIKSIVGVGSWWGK